MNRTRRVEKHLGAVRSGIFVALAFVVLGRLDVSAATVSGTVSTAPEMVAINGARVTLFTSNLNFFREVCVFGVTGSTKWAQE